MSAVPAGVRSAIEHALGARGPGIWERAGGSALHTTWRVRRGAARAFVKVNGGESLAMLEAEAAGLEALRAAGAIRVPAVLACGAAPDGAFLALEWLDLDAGGRDAALGRALARLHGTTAERFGWSRDNTIGTTPQANAWHDDWAVFFRDCRLAPQLARAAAQGFAAELAEAAALLARVPDLLAGHAPVPSLLHGDLWSGNAARLASGEPVVFDPAVYFGDREADLAMTGLFGGFGPDFYAAYREAAPLAPGFERRRELYNLYHVLNHLNLFGRAYLGQARAMTAGLLAATR